MNKPAPSPRDALGLTSAMEGDLGGAERFLSFIATEVKDLALLSYLPVHLKQRLSALGSDADRLREFVSGYRSAGSGIHYES